MKTKSFFKTILMVVFLVVGLDADAQGMSIATLQHGDQMKAFYGIDALVEALKEAESGDLISLSAGNFNPPEVIEKAVTIQGAGMHLNDWNTAPTVITSNLYVILPEGDNKGLTIEGLSLKNIVINSDVENFSLIKCKMYNIDFNDGSLEEEINAINVLIDKCYIYNDFWTGTEADGGLVVRNSYIKYFNTLSSDASNRYVCNCVIFDDCREGYTASAKYENNIIYHLNPRPTSTYFNNIYSNLYAENPNNYGSDNKQIYGFGEMFVNGFPDGENSDPHLTDEAATEYLGTDGTQVGMYGGATPFSIWPSCPQVTSSEVAPYSDANGKLNVKITIEAGTY